MILKWQILKIHSKAQVDARRKMLLKKFKDELRKLKKQIKNTLLSSTRLKVTKSNKEASPEADAEAKAEASKSLKLKEQTASLNKLAKSKQTLRTVLNNRKMSLSWTISLGRRCFRERI